MEKRSTKKIICLTLLSLSFVLHAEVDLRPVEYGIIFIAGLATGYALTYRAIKNEHNQAIAALRAAYEECKKSQNSIDNVPEQPIIIRRIPRLPQKEHEKEVESNRSLFDKLLFFLGSAA